MILKSAEQSTQKDYKYNEQDFIKVHGNIIEGLESFYITYLKSKAGSDAEKDAEKIYSKTMTEYVRILQYVFNNCRKTVSIPAFDLKEPKQPQLMKDLNKQIAEIQLNYSLSISREHDKYQPIYHKSWENYFLTLQSYWYDKFQAKPKEYQPKKESSYTSKKLPGKINLFGESYDTFEYSQYYDEAEAKKDYPEKIELPIYTDPTKRYSTFIPYHIGVQHRVVNKYNVSYHPGDPHHDQMYIELSLNDQNQKYKKYKILYVTTFGQNKWLFPKERVLPDSEIVFVCEDGILVCSLDSIYQSETQMHSPFCGNNWQQIKPKQFSDSNIVLKAS